MAAMDLVVSFAIFLNTFAFGPQLVLGSIAFVKNKPKTLMSKHVFHGDETCLLQQKTRLTHRTSPASVDASHADSTQASSSAIDLFSAPSAQKHQPAVCDDGWLMKRVDVVNGKMWGHNGRTLDEQSCVHVGDVALGKGAAGAVLMGHEKLLPTGRERDVAVKQLSLPSGRPVVSLKTAPGMGLQDIADQLAPYQEQFDNEVDILRHMRKETAHIVELYGFNRDELAMEMEPLTGGDLWSKRELFPLHPVAAREVLRQAVQALYDCHNHNVAHRDFKEHQLAFVEPIQQETGRGMFTFTESGWKTTLKLLDFGFAKRLGGRNYFTRESSQIKQYAAAPTYEYASPELIRNEKVQLMQMLHNPQAGEFEEYSMYAPDMWALGVVAFQITCDSRDGAPQSFLGALSSITGISYRERVHKYDLGRVTMDHISLLLHQNYPHSDEYESLKDFILQALEVDVGKRATAQRLLEHAFLKE